ncbi:MAG: hypothetical protein AAF409_11755 [Pseudomonadota bacterium]
MSVVSTKKDPVLKATVAFSDAAASSPRPRRKRPAPLSVRLTDAERAALEKAADGQSLNSYVKDQLFSASGKAARSRRRKPVKDQVALAQALGLLGQMDLGPSLKALTQAVETGALDVSPEVEEELRAACAAVIAIRSELLRALGYAGGENS